MDSSGTGVVTLAQIIGSLGTPALLALNLLAFALNLVHTRRAFDRETARADRERDRADALQKFVTEEMVPALTRATDALRERADNARRPR